MQRPGFPGWGLDTRLMTLLCKKNYCYEIKRSDNLSVCRSTALVDLGGFFSFLILYIISRTPQTGDQPVARLLPAHRINAHRHPCLECDLKPRSQRSSEQRQFMP
jgi:hypothetical protein